MNGHPSRSSAPASGEGKPSRTGQEQDRPAPAGACPKCGALMPPDSALGLCPGCLLNAAALETGSGSAEPDRPTTRHPDRVKDYELLGVIGQGGMGVVYKARQVSVSRTVALKMVLPALPSPTFLRRFQTEVQAAARLSHAHIVPVYEVGEHEGHAFFTMPLVQGETLRQQLREKKWGAANGESSLSKSQVHSLEKAAAILMSRVARAVQYAHDHGVFHRDLKPGNILVDEEGEPHLLDFGLAKITYTDGEGSDPGLTLPDSVLGTPAYMSPEQATGFRNVRLVDDPVLAGCDIYSMGALLYELLTGQPPFSGVSPQEILSKVQTETPPRLRSIHPWIDPDLETICLKCLEKNARHRYGTAAGLAEDLERWLNKRPILARPSGPLKRTGRWIKRNPLGSALIFNLFVGLLVTLWFLRLIADQSEHIGQLGWAIFNSGLDDISTVADPFSGLEFVTIPRLSMAVLAGGDPVIDDSDAQAKLTFGIAASREPRGLANDWSKILMDLEHIAAAKMPNSEKLLFELRLFRRGKAGDQVLARDPSPYCDFTLMSPLDYLLAKERQPGVRLLAALSDNESKGFVIFVRQDSSITNLADLKGKIVGLGDPSSPATTLAKALLALAGLDAAQVQLIETDEDEGGNRIQLQAVLDGRYQAGVCTLKQFARWGPKPPGLRKLDEFPSFVPKLLAARAGLTEDLYISLRDALLDLPAQPLLGKLQPVEEKDLEPLRQALQRSRAAFPGSLPARPTTALPAPQIIPEAREPALPTGF